jgi:hypothetical protein
MRGTVTAVAGNTIRVAAAPSQVSREDYDRVSGALISVTTEFIPAQPPREFVAEGPLAHGKYLEGGNTWSQFRFADIKVGDKVWFDWREVNGVRYFASICIWRRPGGKVPLSATEKPGEERLWLERANAFYELKEFGTPLPEKFRPKPEKHLSDAEIEKLYGIKIQKGPTVAPPSLPATPVPKQQGSPPSIQNVPPPASPIMQ